MHCLQCSGALVPYACQGLALVQMGGGRKKAVDCPFTQNSAHRRSRFSRQPQPHAEARSNASGLMPPRIPSSVCCGWFVGSAWANLMFPEKRTSSDSCRIPDDCMDLRAAICKGDSQFILQAWRDARRPTRGENLCRLGPDFQVLASRQ